MGSAGGMAVVRRYISVLSPFCARLHLAGTAGGTQEGLLVSGMGLVPGSLLLNLLQSPCCGAAEVIG